MLDCLPTGLLDFSSMYKWQVKNDHHHNVLWQVIIDHQCERPVSGSQMVAPLVAQNVTAKPGLIADDGDYDDLNVFGI